MDVRDRARAYMRTVDPAISGQHGHNATFLAAVALVKGFGLTEAEALEVLRDEFNPRCQPPWREAALAYKVRSAAARGKPPPGCGDLWLAGEAAEWEAGREGAKQPRSAEPARAVDEAAREDGVAVKLDFDPEVLRRCFRPEVASAEWFMARSPRVVEGIGPGDYLASIYGAEDRVLIFTEKRSQGNLMFWRGQFWKLGNSPEVKAGPGAAPRGGPEGVWYLVQPVNGKWLPKEEGQLSRRSGANLVRCPYLVIESDPPEHEDRDEMRALWLSFLAQLPLPIVAVYESGGKSIHALVRLEGCEAAEEFNVYRCLLSPFLTKHGADFRAIRPVQLSRLPGCYRGERLQRLLYLNPAPSARGIPILESPAPAKR